MPLMQELKAIIEATTAPTWEWSELPQRPEHRLRMTAREPSLRRSRILNMRRGWAR